MARIPLGLGLTLLALAALAPLTASPSFGLLYAAPELRALNLAPALCVLACYYHPWGPTEPAVSELEAWAVGLTTAALSALSVPVEAALSLATMCALAGRALRSHSAELRQRRLGYLCLGLFMVVYPTAIALIQLETSRLTPLVFDLRAYQLDRLDGLQPAFEIARFAVCHPWFGEMLSFVYAGLPVAMLFSAFFGLRYADRVHFDLLAALVLGGVLGLALYAIYPAAGTGYLSEQLGQSFPSPRDPGLGAGLPALMHCPEDWRRNCSPSMHMSLALTIWFGISPISRRARLLGALFCVVTAAATLVDGNHYWCDLVPSFPLALGTVALCSRKRPGRALCAVTGLGLTLTLLLAARFGHLFLLRHRYEALAVQAVVVAGTLAVARHLSSVSEM